MTQASHTASARHITGRQVLIALVGVFALVFAVNGTFAYFAVSTWPGYSQSDAYQHGLHYNNVLEEARRQKALGWTSSVAMDGAGTVRVRMIDANNAPVRVSSLTVTLSRPLGDPRETVVVLDVDRDGSFSGRLTPLADGWWNAVVRAQDAAGHEYRMQHSVEARS